MESKTMKTLSSILFHVESQPIEKVAKGFTANSELKQAIIGYPEKDVKQILNVCSERYNLISNTDILLPLTDLLEERFKNIQTKVINEDNTLFEVSYIPTKGKRILGEILPRFIFQNSYNGQKKAALTCGLYRTVCENGAVMPIKGKTIQYVFKHNDRQIFQLKEVEQFLTMAFENFPQVQNDIETMQAKKIKLSDLDKTLLDIANGSKFPTKAFKQATDRVLFEVDTLKLEPTIWIAYNGLNYVLSHDRNYSIQQHVRNDMDFKLYSNALELATV
jgi:hypothetical protein